MLSGVVFAALLGVASGAAAERPSIGAAAPLPVGRDLDGRERPLKQLMGSRGLVILFWAGWSDRSIEQLRRLNASAAELSAHGVSVAAVSVEHYAMDEEKTSRLRRMVEQLGVRVPVLVDRGLELFHAYGVVTVPSTALIDSKGRLAYFLFGYSIEEREELFDAIDATAGIKRRPSPPARRVASAALRRLQLGRFQLSRGQEGPARESFEQASKADETFADPLVELAALALDANDAAAARGLLDRAAALSADHAGVRRERARLALLEGRTADAERELQALSSNGADSAAFAYLGYLLHSAAARVRAEAAFDRAQALSGIDPRAYAAPAPSPAAVRSAMTTYRREVAPGRR
jgi:peroxiredoxin